MDMWYKKLVSSIVAPLDYIKGFIEILSVETPRYSFVIHKIDLLYFNGLMRAELTYTPLGCYRPVKEKISSLSLSFVMTKFKPSHARILVGIDTLERCLNLTQRDHLAVYLDFVSGCIKRLHSHQSEEYVSDVISH